MLTPAGQQVTTRYMPDVTGNDARVQIRQYRDIQPRKMCDECAAMPSSARNST